MTVLTGFYDVNVLVFLEPGDPLVSQPILVSQLVPQAVGIAFRLSGFCTAALSCY